MHKHKAAGTICILYITWLKATLSEKSCLLVSCRPGNWDSAPDQVLIGITINTTAWLHFRQHALWDIQVFQNLFIPFSLMDVKKHGSGSVGVIRHMNFPFCQFPDQPGIYCSKEKFPILRTLSGTFYMIQDPFQFRSGKIGVRNQTGFLSNQLWHAVFFHLLNHISCSATLPYNCRINRLSCLLIPHNRSLSLIRDSDSVNILCIYTDLTHGFCSHWNLGGPDFLRIMFHPAWLRVILFVLFLCYAAHISLFIK